MRDWRETDSWRTGDIFRVLRKVIRSCSNIFLMVNLLEFYTNEPWILKSSKKVTQSTALCAKLEQVTDPRIPSTTIKFLSFNVFKSMS